MKNSLAVCGIFMLLLFLMSCKKSDTNPSNSTGSVTFKIDTTGNNNFTSTYSGGIWEPNNALLSITAKGGKSIIVINIAMPNGLKVGDYSFGASTGFSTAFFRPDTLIATEGYYSIVSGASGSVKISSVSSDSVVTGTFNFILIDPVTGKTKRLSNGAITGVKIVNNTSIVTGGTNSFSAKIDGTLWSPKQITGSKNFGTISITASDGVKSMGLTIIETAKAGVYTMDSFSDYSAQYLPSLSSATSYVPDPSTSKLTILEHNTSTRRMRGSFNFKGSAFPTPTTKTYTITEGVFDVKY